MNGIANDTIAAIATGPGGALGVVRLSGPDALRICDSIFRAASGRPLSVAGGYTLHYGHVIDPVINETGAGEIPEKAEYDLHHTGTIKPPAAIDRHTPAKLIDDVIVSVFRAPRSFTGEDMAEISCHGSRYILQEVLRLLIRSGARTAHPGEFTMRGFLAGKLDLVQAEAVADMISASDRMTHALATNQMRGGYTRDFMALRDDLLRLSSLLELELDFGEEDVEFADRRELSSLISTIRRHIGSLTESFRLGNAIKEGIAVAIAGKPNVGKSTLLNTLLRDDRAMVSDIPGTTRDVVEESISLDGIRYRFLDTAGIRQTDDTLEQMGIRRTMSAVEHADVILLVVDAGVDAASVVHDIRSSLENLALRPEQKLLILINKIDRIGFTDEWDGAAKLTESVRAQIACEAEIIPISAKTGINIDTLLSSLSWLVDTHRISAGDTVISNMRHYEALSGASSALERATDALKMGIPGDLISQDIREALHHLGTISGEITTDEILGEIFSKFCIGK